MKRILSITASASGDNSKSNQLSASIIERLRDTYPGSIVTRTDLGRKPLPHLEEVHLAGFYAPDDQLTDAHKEAVKNSNEAVQAVFDADIIVIGVPFYNFGIPSTLKSWIDHIARAGLTFRYTKDGPEGLIRNKKVYLAIASGGVYSEGFMKKFDHTESYLIDVLGFLGMTDVSVFRIEGTVVPGLKEQAAPKALETVSEFAF